MYNKLFASILDSSIWLENNPTRIVWFTFLAAMDEDGFARFASIRNLANRARVSNEEAAEAVAVLEAPDPDSSDPANDGRRAERVPGGWIVLNSVKYRELATRLISRERTRKRVANFREKHQCNAYVTLCNDEKRSVTTSETYSESRSETETKSEKGDSGGDQWQTPTLGVDQMSGPDLVDSARPVEPEKKTKKLASTGKTKAPETLTPTDATVAVAKKTGRNIEDDWEACRDWAWAKGEMKSDWQATLRGWMRRNSSSSPDKSQQTMILPASEPRF